MRRFIISLITILPFIAMIALAIESTQLIILFLLLFTVILIYYIMKMKYIYNQYYNDYKEKYSKKMNL